MRLLADTHLLMWAVGPDELLPETARELMADTQNELLFSVVSLWELAIKRSLRRTEAQLDPRVLRKELLDNGYKELAVISEHAFGVETLPLIHKDPFDRLLVAQAMVEGITLLTSDPVVGRYPGPIQLV